MNRDQNISLRIIPFRNGNIMFTQPIPWPSALKAEEKLAASITKLKKEQIDILNLNIKFRAKSIIFKLIELSQKIHNKKKMILTLNNLSQVVLGRLSTGTANQTEISRIHIEVTKLTQSISRLKAISTFSSNSNPLSADIAASNTSITGANRCGSSSLCT